MGQERLDVEKPGRMGFWAPPTNENRAIRKNREDTIPMTAQFEYHRHEFEGYLGNVP